MTRSVLRGLRAVALTGTLVLASGAAFAADPIKLGVLEDQSGDFAVATIGKVHAIQLAAEEINKAGGIAGRQIELSLTTPSPTIRATRNSCGACCSMTRSTWCSAASRPHRARRTVRSSTSTTARVLQQPVRRRRLRRAHDRHRRGAGAAVLDPDSLDDGEVRQEGLHDRRRLQFRPDLGRMGAQHRQGARRHDGRRGVHPARRVAVLANHPEHPEGQAGFAGDAPGRHRAGLLLRAGGFRQYQSADGIVGQCRAGL